MKQNLLAMVLCMACLAMYAQGQIVVRTADGSKEEISLDKKPVVTFGVYGDKVKVSYAGKQKELDVKYLEVEVDSETVSPNELVIINMDGTKVLLPLSAINYISQASYEKEADYLSKVIARDPAVSIYNEALKATHMDDSLKHYMDMSYTWANDQDRIDSCTWTNNKLCIHVAVAYDNVAYPERRYYNFTALLVPDAVLKEKYGITDLDGLRQKAHELYDPMYPEDAGITDETDRRNALNRFISYHLLPIYGGYYKLTGIDGGRLMNNFDRRKADVADWYETLMPYSIMKFSFPSGMQVGLYVNRRGVQAGADERGVFVRGAKIAPVDEGPQQPYAVNGIYHYIDDIVAYDRDMQEIVCNDRIRLDCTTLSPDFMTQLTDGEIARGHSSAAFTSADQNRYGAGGQGPIAASNVDHGVGFKAGFVRNFEYNNDTHLHVRNRVLNFWSYQGDELIVIGPFDVKVKLPSLPAGKYELRLATCMGFSSRGLINMYIDDKLVEENVDFRVSGYLSDSPYNYGQETMVVDGVNVTRYYPQQGPGWRSDSELQQIQEKYWEEDIITIEEDGDVVTVNNGFKLKDASTVFFELYPDETEETELLADFSVEDEAYYAFLGLFQQSDMSYYKTAHQAWAQAQNNPDQYVFEGNEPIYPYSDEMQDYYNKLVDKDALIKYGPVKYFDQMFRAKGWMKGTASYSPGQHEMFEGDTTFRDISNTLRKIVGTFVTDGKSDHYFRLVQQLPMSNPNASELSLDYIELIPVGKIEYENIY